MLCVPGNSRCLYIRVLVLLKNVLLKLLLWLFLLWFALWFQITVTGFLLNVTKHKDALQEHTECALTAGGYHVPVTKVELVQSKISWVLDTNCFTVWKLTFLLLSITCNTYIDLGCSCVLGIWLSSNEHRVYVATWFKHIFISLVLLLNSFLWHCWWESKQNLVNFCFNNVLLVVLGLFVNCGLFLALSDKYFFGGPKGKNQLQWDFSSI